MTDDSQLQKNAAGYAQDLLSFLADNQHSLSPLLILHHNYPDPDALAAAFALHFLARECCNIESRIAYSGVIGRTENQAMVSILRIPVHRLKPVDLKKYRQIALVDTQPAFENNPFPGNRKATMVSDIVSLPPSLTVEAAANHYFLRYGFGEFLVFDNGKFIGFITLKEIKNIPREAWRLKKVSEILAPPTGDGRCPRKRT